MFSRLHIYSVHINPALPQPYEEAKFIEEGFSWKAFIFGIFWTLYHRLWWQALALFVMSGILMQLLGSGTLTRFGTSVVELAVLLFVGMEGNDWRRADLRRKGYITADIVTGDSLLRAEQRFFDRYFASKPSPAAA